MFPITTGMAVLLWILGGLVAGLIAVLTYLNLGRDKLSRRFQAYISDDNNEVEVPLATYNDLVETKRKYDREHTPGAMVPAL